MKQYDKSKGDLTYNQAQHQRSWNRLRDSRIDEEQTIQGNREFLHKIVGWIDADVYKTTYATKIKILNQVHTTCRDSNMEVFKIFDESSPEALEEATQIAKALNKWLTDRYPNTNTINNIISHFQQVAKYYREEEDSAGMCNAVSRLKTRPTPTVIVEAEDVLRWEEITKIVDGASCSRDKAVMMLMMEGTRPTDVFNIQIKDILGHNDPSKRWAVEVMGKVDIKLRRTKPRRISLGNAQPYLKKYLQEHWYNFNKESPNFRTNTREEGGLGRITNIDGEAFLCCAQEGRQQTRSLKRYRQNNNIPDEVENEDIPAGPWMQITYTAYGKIFKEAARSAGYSADEIKQMSAAMYRKSFATDTGSVEGRTRTEMENLMGWTAGSKVSQHYIKKDNGDENKAIKQRDNGEEVTVYRPQHQGRVITCKHCSERTMPHLVDCMFCGQELDALGAYMIEEEQQRIESLKRQLADLESQLAQRDIELVNPGEKIQEGTA